MAETGAAEVQFGYTEFSIINQDPILVDLDLLRTTPFDRTRSKNTGQIASNHIHKDVVLGCMSTSAEKWVWPTATVYNRLHLKEHN